MAAKRTLRDLHRKMDLILQHLDIDYEAEPRRNYNPPAPEEEPESDQETA